MGCNSLRQCGPVRLGWMLETNRLSLKSSGYLVVLGMFCKQIPCCLLWFEQVFTVAVLRVWGVGRPSWASPRPKQNYWRWFLHVQTWGSNTNTVVFEIKRCMCIIFLRKEDFDGFWFNVYQFILWAQQNEALKSHFPRVSLIEWSFKHWRVWG